MGVDRQVGVRFEKKDYKKIFEFAKREDRSAAYIVRRFVLEGLENEEQRRKTQKRRTSDGCS